MFSAVRVVERLALQGRPSGGGEGGRREYLGRLIAAGRTRTLGGEPGRYTVSAEAVRQAAAEGLFDGLACFVDHAPAPDRPSLRDLFGVWHDVVWDEASRAAVGRLRVYETDANRPVAQMLDQMLADGETTRPDVGVSLVFYPLLGGDGTTIERLVMVESADLVIFPAMEQSRILATLGAAGDGEQEQGEMEMEMETNEGLATMDGIDGAAGDWRQALRAAATAAIVEASGLPGPVQERLRAGSYAGPGEVEAAVAQARAELAALEESGVVRLGRRPPREMQIRDPLDEARELVGFFFGAPGAPTPPPNLRRFSDLYVALTGDAHFRGVFDGTRLQFSGATTTTLANLAVDAMNKVIVEQFEALDHYRWFERISRVEPNDGSLQDMKWITLGGVGDLPAVDEGAAYTELSVDDVKETAGFTKRGGYVGITREMIRNSNIQQLQAIPRALAAAAVRTRSAAVSALFTANSGVGPTLAQDGKALFHADHNNLATTALGTDAAAWRAARKECFRHVEVGGAKALGIYPRFLLVPADLYDTALSILGYGEGMPTVYTPEAQGRGFADPRPIPLVVPDWSDAGDWAYIVDPAVYPVIHMSYSQSPGGRSHPIPELFAVVSETSGLMFSNDVLPIKVRDEFALGVNGHRGIGKRNVA